mmetsp:Transcript_114977/g.199345  ORF Transcript_114977/g.199345 Transcript_114977/m.199345 type:complete len:816 (+) Transcript_114977:60-2507(+)
MPAPFRNAADTWGVVAATRGQGKQPAAATSSASLPAAYRPLARGLFSVLQSQSSDEGLCFRSDGFAKLDEALSVASLQSAVEQAAPRSAAALNTAGWGGPMSDELKKAAQAIVIVQGEGGKSCFETWDAEADSQDMWLRAACELELPDEVAEAAKEVSEAPAAAAPDVVAPAAAAAAVAQAAAAAAVSGAAQAPATAPAAVWVPPRLPQTRPIRSNCKWSNLLADDRQSTIRAPNAGYAEGTVQSIPSTTLPQAAREPIQVRGRHNDVRLRDPAAAVTIESWSTNGTQWSSRKAPAENVEEQPQAAGKNELVPKLALPLSSLPPEQTWTNNSSPVRGNAAMPPSQGIDETASQATGPSEILPAGPRCRGQLRAFFPEKGYGFVKSDAVSTGDVWFHADYILGPHPEKLFAQPGTDASGPMMEFDLTWKNGRPRALNLSVVCQIEEEHVRAEDQAAPRLAEDTGNATAAWSTACQDGGQMSPAVERLSRALAALLRHHAERDGLCIRSDGFAKLDEALSVNRLQDIIEQVAPGSAEALNTSGWGGPISPELLESVREIVAKSLNKGVPRFELWDCGEEVWIRATHKHTLRNIEVQSTTLALTNTAHNTPPEDSAEAGPTNYAWEAEAGPGNSAWEAAAVGEREVEAGPGSSEWETKPYADDVEQETSETTRCIGQIRTFMPETGYGFLTCDAVTSGDVYFHSNAIVEGELEKCSGRQNEPATGPMMEFELEWKKGRPRAVKARILATPAAAPMAAETLAAPVAEDFTQCGTESARSTSLAEPVEGKPPVAELLSLLPGDAPEAVRQYLASLAQERC